MKALVACIGILLISYSLTGAVMEKPDKSFRTLQKRIKAIQSPIELKLDKEIKHIVEGYIVRGRKSAEIILGRSFLYFPIFEKYIAQYQLPEVLKYISVIESALDPKAISPTGAGGLWQFMPYTAKQYGLMINEYIDERFDPHRSSEAAAKHLSYLYNKFGDWTLAMAAYNCGEGRMDRSIRKAGSKKYNKVKAYLPKETVKYIQRFIAATYVMNYYLFHDLHPRYPDYNLQLTKTIRVFEQQSLKGLAQKNGVALQLLLKLNPSYLVELVPKNNNGSLVIMPRLGIKPEEFENNSDSE